MTRPTPHQAMSLGFSSCPNDTFMFHGVVEGDVPLPGIELDVVMDDIEGLNRRALGEHPDGRLAITKVSVAALGWITDRYAVLGSGAALGRGCGPLVVRRSDDSRLQTLADLRGRKIAIPGERTTANLLLRSFAPPQLDTVAMRFEAIMPAVAAGQVDAGLIIHESRFTYPDHDLACVADLGEVWESRTDLPLPLGVIVADRTLDNADVDAFERALSASVQLARREPARSRLYVRRHAQEMSDEVCQRHIDLYVNAYSVDLGDEGRTAIDTLLDRGRERGLLPPGASPWR